MTEMDRKIPVGVLGATGMVGQRFIFLLNNHPWFEVVCVAASPKSAGKSYEQAVDGRWVMEGSIPPDIASMNVFAVERDMVKIANSSSLVFSALDMEKKSIRLLEDQFASLGLAVVSNNSAHRWTKDVPMIMPEINPQHLELIRQQQINHGWERGFVVVKPNCSIQSYVPLLTPLLGFEPREVIVTTLQAVSGAGRTLESWPEMQDNVIPYIEGDEDKSEEEPMRIWGELNGGIIDLATEPQIKATCIRVPVEDGHMASVAVSFAKKPTKSEILACWEAFDPLKDLNLPSAPTPLITIMRDENRPQTRLDRMIGSGMGISVGRLREWNKSGFMFVGLSHNTVRGAAGGAILIAELLKVKGYF